MLIVLYDYSYIITRCCYCLELVLWAAILTMNEKGEMDFKAVIRYNFTTKEITNTTVAAIGLGEAFASDPTGGTMSTANTEQYCHR